MSTILITVPNGCIGSSEVAEAVFESMQRTNAKKITLACIAGCDKKQRMGLIAFSENLLQYVPRSAPIMIGDSANGKLPELLAAEELKNHFLFSPPEPLFIILAEKNQGVELLKFLAAGDDPASLALRYSLKEELNKRLKSASAIPIRVFN